MEFVSSELGKDPIVVEGFFAASPSKVFEAWTNPEIIMQWFGLAPNSLLSANIDLREGGAWQFVKSKDNTKSVGFEGTYIDIQHDKKLVFTWSLVIETADGDRDATPPSRVEVDFIQTGEGTTLKLVHSKIHSNDTAMRFV